MNSLRLLIRNILNESLKEDLIFADKVYRGKYYGKKPKNALTDLLGAIQIYKQDGSELSLNRVKELNRIADSYKRQLGIIPPESKMFEENLDYDYKKWKRRNVTIRGITEFGESNGGGAQFGKGLYTAALSNKDLAKNMVEYTLL